MKTILFTTLLALFCLLSGCAQYGTQYGSGTLIGVRAGLPNGVNLVLGFQRYEAVACEPDTRVVIGIEGEVTATGMNGKQSAEFGRRN